MRNRGCFLCAVIVIGWIGTEQLGAGVMAGPFVNPSNGFSYTLLTPDSWTNSEAEAVAMGGHLATVNSAAEDNFLLTTFLPFISAPTGSLLIGFEDLTQDGHFVWTSGAPVVYTNWGSGEPNNLTSEIYTNLELQNFNSILAGQWNDVQNGSSALPQYGVVEVVPEPSSLSLFALAALVAGLSRRTRRGIRV